MATYEEIYGKRVKEFDSDPTLENSYEGQVWYDKSTGVLKSVVSFGAWLSASNMGTGRILGAGGGSTVNASLMCGGLTPSSTANSEEYNGFVWTEGNNIPTSTDGAAFFGTQTAAIAASGRQPPANTGTQVSYSYDGTSWTSTPNTGTASRNDAGAGTQTAGLIFGGYTPGVQNKTVEWNGSSWTNGNNMNNPREGHAGAGISQTDALSMGGNPNPPSTLVEAYDGTNWTSVADLPVGRPGARGATGPGSAALISGSPNIVNLWNGSSWSTLPGTLASARSSNQMSGVGQTNALLYGGGAAPPYSSATEEYNFGINTVTAAAWAAGGTMGQVRSVVGGFGTQTAALMCGGNHPGTTQHANAEQYDGTSFSEQNDMGTARSQLGSCGTLTAGLVFGGDVYPTSPRNTGVTEEWDGSSFSEQTDMSTVRRSITSFGTQTAAVAAAGYVTAALANVEEYNGSSWTSVTSLPAAYNASGSAGVETAGLVFGGLNPSNPVTAVTVEYDGSNWTSGGSLITGRWGLNGGPVGTQSDALAFGGRTPGSTYYTNTEGYDGTSWSARPNLASAEYETGKAGTSSAALSAGGNDGSSAKATSEEFTGGTETVTFKTLTTS